MTYILFCGICCSPRRLSERRSDYWRFYVVFVIVVALKELLDAVSPQFALSFFDYISILPLWVIDVILVKIVIGNVRHKWRLHPFASQLFPIKTFEPRMLF